MTIAGGFGLMAGLFVALAIVFEIAGDVSPSARNERRHHRGAFGMVLAAAGSALVAIWLWVAGI